MHAIIERTANFVCKQGAQFEIMLKAKQARNSQFDFLRFDHYLNPYYKFIQKAMKEGRYPLPAGSKSDEKQSMWAGGGAGARGSPWARGRGGAGEPLRGRRGPAADARGCTCSRPIVWQLFSLLGENGLLISTFMARWSLAKDGCCGGITLRAGGLPSVWLCDVP